MTHPLRTTVDDFVAGLIALKEGPVTRESVTRYMDAVRPPMESLAPYVWWRDSFYTRNLIYRDDLFEVMTICWRPGQRTAVHTHNGQLGWMTVPQGAVTVSNYRYVRCNCPENQNVVGLDCLGGATQIELDRIGAATCHEGGAVVTVDKLQTIHRIENEDPAEAGCVSLHVYSRPFDSCIAFDLEKQRCFRRVLNYYSRYGRLEPEHAGQKGR